jgi:hypothetical protein
MINDTADKIVSDVIDIAEQFIASVVDTVDKHLLAIISTNFRKKVEMILMEYSGARGTLIHGKKLKSKSRVRLPIMKKNTMRAAPGFFSLYPYLVGFMSDVSPSKPLE